MRLELTDVGHRFGASPWLFRRLTAALHPNRSYALVGPSGSGKSTLLHLVAGWAAPIEGSVGRSGIAKTSWVFQNPHGMAGRTVLDHAVLPLLARDHRRADAEPAAMDLLRQVRLDHAAHQPFGSLSGGEAQRLMLARAVAADPDLLLVDEPTAQLDAVTARTINGVLGSLASPTRIVIIATHDRETREHCTDVIDLAAHAPHDGEGHASTMPAGRAET